MDCTRTFFTVGVVGPAAGLPACLTDTEALALGFVGDVGTGFFTSGSGASGASAGAGSAVCPTPLTAGSVGSPSAAGAGVTSSAGASPGVVSSPSFTSCCSGSGCDSAVGVVSVSRTVSRSSTAAIGGWVSISAIRVEQYYR